MAHDYSAEYPRGYTLARQRCSVRLLTIFDRELSCYPDVDWRASETPLGILYCMSSYVLAGIPTLFFLAEGYSNRNRRASLYGALTHIADRPERLEITNLDNCHDALESQFFTFEDLEQCPVESLRAILVCDFYRYLNEQTRSIKARQRGISTTLSDLEWERNVCTDRLRVTELDIEINDIKQRQARCMTFMEEFTRAGYARPILERLQREFIAAQHAENIAVKQRYMQKWQHASTNFEILIRKIDSRIAEMNNQNINLQDDTLITAAKELRRILQEAKDSFAGKVGDLSFNQLDRVVASERFILICEDAIRNASLILEKDKTYDWRYVLADIANALVFITTLSLSYCVTGQYRLFTPLSRVEGNAAEILHDAESTLTRIRQNM